MITTELGGHSGCRILLCEPEDGNPFVRKISKDIDYNKRLINQKQKQENFKASSIKVPLVLADGYTNSGHYYFDMEYIHGNTLAEYIKSIEISKVGEVVRKIITGMSETSKDGVVEEERFTNKITELGGQLFALENDVVNKALGLLKKHDWSLFSGSYCHGDLTLENIIIRNNDVYLIDFLDSFYDCWILDMGTLLQDAQLLWSYRHEESLSINTIIRLMVFRDILIDEVKRVLGDEYIEIYYALLLKVVRIYPYISDEETYIYLNNKTKQLVEFLENMDNE